MTTAPARDAATGPLSFAEEAAWAEFRADPQTFGRRRAVLALDLPAGAARSDVERLVAAIVARHDILRTAYDTVAGRPTRFVHDRYPHPVVGADPAGYPPPAAGTHLTPADLVQVFLAGTPSGGQVLTFVLHEMITDPWSCARLRAEVSRSLSGPLDAGPAAHAAPTAGFAEYARQERDRPLAHDLAQYWRQRLAGCDEVPDCLPGDGPDASGDTAGELVAILLDHRTQALRDLCRQARASAFMAVVALVNAALAGRTGRRDLLLATLASTRGRQWPDVHGNFGNLVLLRTVLPPDPTFTEVLAGTRRAVLGALAHQPVPHARLRDGAPPPRPPVRVTYLPRDTHHFDRALRVRPSGAVWREDADVPGWPLDLGFAEDSRDRVAVWASYDPRRFTHATVESLVDSVGALLDRVGAAHDPLVATP